MSTEKITEVGPRDWARALSRLTAINDELALTLTTEPLYKFFFASLVIEFRINERLTGGLGIYYVGQ